MLVRFKYDLQLFKMFHFRLNFVLLSFKFQMCLLSCVLLAFSACRIEALWLLNLVSKVVEQSPMYDWLELLSCLVAVAWYIILPFNRQWEGCLQLHCVV